MSFTVGSLVQARGREWVVLPESADDVGIGKTVEACLVARELLDRGETNRLVVLCPPHLAEQWRQELREKFNLDAELLLPSTVRKLEGQCVGESVFRRSPHLIVPSTSSSRSATATTSCASASPRSTLIAAASACAGGQRWPCCALLPPVPPPNTSPRICATPCAASRSWPSLACFPPPTAQRSWKRS